MHHSLKNELPFLVAMASFIYIKTGLSILLKHVKNIQTNVCCVINTSMMV